MKLLLSLILFAAQDPTPVEDLQPILAPLRAETEATAFAGAIVTADGLVALGHDGTHGVGRDTPIDAQSRFHLGSCTKAMTATLAATFVEEGALAWDSTLVSAFPELEEGMHEDWRAVTLAQLLSHTAGAPSDLAKFKLLRMRVHLGEGRLIAKRLDAVKTLSAKPPLFAPGSKYQYSNWGFVLAGAMMERVGEATWEDLMRTRLFEPLGMESAGFGAPNRGGKEAHPYGHTAKGEPREEMDNPDSMAPAGLVHATLEDWAKFVRLHIRGARGEEGLLLKPESFAAMHAPQPGTESRYGGGWVVAKRGWSEGPVLTHSGTNTYWYCTTWLAPTEGFAVLVATNRGGDQSARVVDKACWTLIQKAKGARKDG